jgi:hypothetical protein
MNSLNSKLHLLVFFVFSALSLRAAEWGPTSNGLRMSASIVRNEFENNELEVMIENTTSEETLVVLGRADVPFDAVHVIVGPPNSPETPAFYIGGRGIAPGRFMPMVVPLLAKSRYKFRTLLGAWGFFAPSIQRVEELLTKPASLRVELRNPIRERIDNAALADCYASRRFWNGTLNSQKLRFPVITPERSMRTCAGRMTNSLCMSITIISGKKTPQQLELVLRNNTSTDRMLPLGRSGQGFSSSVHLYVQAASKTTSIPLRLTTRDAVTHLQQTWLPLLAKSEYKIRVLLTGLSVLPSYQKALQDTANQPFSLHVEISVHRDDSAINANCYPVCLEPPPPPGHIRRQALDQLCWTGKLVSNMIRSLLSTGPLDSSNESDSVR